jgi:hypothetical protein
MRKSPSNQPSSRIVVLIPHRSPPVVFRAARAKLVARAEFALREVRGTPTASVRGTRASFDGAWRGLAQDLLDAQHFGSLHDAIDHYRLCDRPLPVQARSAVLSALKRLATTEAAAPQRPPDADGH